MKRETHVAVLGTACAPVPRTAPSGECLALWEAVGVRSHANKALTSFFYHYMTTFKQKVMLTESHAPFPTEAFLVRIPPLSLDSFCEQRAL